MGKATNNANDPNAPAFSAHRTSSTQSITADAWTKVQCQTEEFDTASAYDNATNYRFTPLVAGYYQINGQITPAGTTISRVLAAIYKNGSTHRIGSDHTVDGRSVVSALVFLNGSTDYVELFGFVSAASGTGFAAGSTAGADTYFQGVLVRPT